MWTLNNMLLSNKLVKEEIKRKKNLKTNDNGNTTQRNVLDATKVVLTGKFIVINAYIKTEEINNLTLYISKVEKKNKLSSSQQKEGNIDQNGNK